MKRRFDFKLERVAKIRAVEERVARAERLSAEMLARAAEARRDQARAVLQRSRAWLGELLAGRVDARGVLQAHRALDLEVERLRRTSESARTVRTQTERMAAAHRARKSAARALEELRLRARARHRELLEKEDNAALDEVAQRLRAAETPSSSGPQRSDLGSGNSPDPAS
jgi:hypothetical protein